MLVKIRSAVAWKGWVAAEGLMEKGTRESASVTDVSVY